MARILVRQEPDEGYNPFRRSELLPPKGGKFSNECGEQDGLSVDRSVNLTAAELLARSAARADEKNAIRQQRGKAANQYAVGASIAQVDELRGIRSPSVNGSQVVFVYDDAIENNSEHAVLRISASVPEEEVALVLADLKKTFSERVTL